MNKHEFMEYVQFLGKAFDFTPPTDKNLLAAWYKPFENIHPTIAKKMAELYLYNEPGKFQLAKLLKYKDQAMRGLTYHEESKDCPICGGCGWARIEVYDINYSHPIEVCRRCICAAGESLNSKYRQLSKEDMEENFLDWDKVFRPKIQVFKEETK
jgi:hypothetical protein